MKKFLATGLFTLAMTSTAMAATCLPLNDIGDHKAIDDSTIEVPTSHGKFLINTNGTCDFKFADGIGFKPFSSFEVCPGDEMFTWEQGIGQTGSCIIDTITKE